MEQNDISEKNKGKIKSRNSIYFSISFRYTNLGFIYFIKCIAITNYILNEIGTIFYNGMSVGNKENKVMEMYV